MFDRYVETKKGWPHAHAQPLTGALAGALPTASSLWRREYFVFHVGTYRGPVLGDTDTFAELAAEVIR